MGVKIKAGILDPYMPSGDEEFLVGAWIGCLQWAISEPKIIDTFHLDTGFSWVPPRNGLDAMIDDATGAAEGFVVEFVKWFNANVWGDLPAPLGDPTAKDGER